MPENERKYADGGTYLSIVRLHDRRSNLLVREIGALFALGEMESGVWAADRCSARSLEAGATQQARNWRAKARPTRL